MKNTLVNCTAVFACCLFLTGCGGEDLPDMHTVSGTVTHDGKPVSELKIEMQPTAGGRSSTGLSDESGKFTMRYKQGIPGVTAGENSVHVIWEPSDPELAPKIDDPSFTPPAPYDAILKKYGDPESSPLKVTIDSDSDSYELKLD